jgi:3-phosphoshikimate 1-carboxyvinyltransferase
MQNLSINKGSLISEVMVPPSKSYANRALIVSAAKKDKVVLRNLPEATDVTILLECLSKLGLKLVTTKNQTVIENSFPECEENGCELEVGEGGTTARFLAGLLLLGSKPYKLILGERLKERPWDEFIDQVKLLGGKISLNDDVLTLQGPIHFPNEMEVDCSKTTQFATAFQLIAPAGKKIIPIHLNSSVSYWKMTEKLIIDIANQSVYDIPLDWSSASYPMAFAALNQDIYFPGLKFDEFQADAKFYDILKSYNLIVDGPEGMTVKKGYSRGELDFDVSDCLDLVPTLGYFLAHIDGKHTLRGIQNLVHKESDRLGEVIKLLAQFNRKATTDGQTLMIEGRSEVTSQKVDLKLPFDHRMVMVGTLFLLQHGGGNVAPADAVNKSYPGFFKLLR